MGERRERRGEGKVNDEIASSTFNGVTGPRRCDHTTDSAQEPGTTKYIGN